MTFQIKALVMNDKVLVHGIAKEDGKIYNLEIKPKDYVFEKVELTKYGDLYKDLDKLMSLFKINIVSKLLPDLNKPGYEAGTEASSTAQQQQQQQQQQQPQRREPRDPYPSHPAANDPYYDPLRVPGTGRMPPFGVGYGDTFPQPGPGFIVPPGGMGNLVGPNHPGFGPRVNDPYAGNYGGGFADPVRLPRGAVPPGARFDPFGPPGGPGGPRGPGGPGGFPGGPGGMNRFGPDFDDLPPPGGSGYDNMFL